MLPALNAGIRKNVSGIIALGLRCSQMTNPTSRTAAMIERGDDQRVAPSALVRLDQAEGECEQPAGSEREARQVEMPRLGRHRLTNGPPGDREGDHADRHVDEEHGLPPTLLDDPAAQGRPQCEGEAADAGPQPDRAGALLRWERDREDREGAGHQQGGSDALERPERDQLGARPREPTPERGEREDRQPGEEHLLPPVAVAQDAAREQQRREHEDVPVDDPLQIGDRRAQAPAGSWGGRC